MTQNKYVRRRARAAARTAASIDPGAVWLTRLAWGLLFAIAIAGYALAATTHQAVIHPPAHVDPGMRVKPAAHANLPTPVVHPHVSRGNTIVVPK